MLSIVELVNCFTLSGARIMVEKIIGDVKIALPQVLDISMVQTMHKELILNSEDRNSFHLDASAVKKITSPAIQLIVSFMNHITKNDGQLLVDSPLMKWRGRWLILVYWS